jgi:hypothetical protein
LAIRNIENTVRYLGVDIDDALTLSPREPKFEQSPASRTAREPAQTDEPMAATKDPIPGRKGGYVGVSGGRAT